MSRTIASLSIASLGIAALAATTNGPAIDVSRFTGLAKISLNSSAVGGTNSPTSTTTLQHSADGATNWEDVRMGAFPAVTGAGASSQDIMLNADSLRKFVRVVDTLTGTSPTVTRSVCLVGKLAY